jgi:hypothetical protein
MYVQGLILRFLGYFRLYRSRLLLHISCPHTILGFSLTATYPSSSVPPPPLAPRLVLDFSLTAHFEEPHT